MNPDKSAPARVRRDGWTIDRQVKFIRALFAHGSVTRAAAAAGMSRESAYRLRARPGHRDFARSWDAAVAAKGHRLGAEGHSARGATPPRSSRESHEGHAAAQFAQHCPVGKLRRPPRAA